MFFGDIMLEFINKFIWAIATSFIILSSIYFSLSLGFVQFKFREMFKNLFKKENREIGITPVQSFFMTLGSRIGVGSIAGVSLALHLGGPGSIFWMWLSAFLSASNTFCETVLGIIYREKDGKDYKGGPSYYIRNGLNKPKLGTIYALIILISFVGGFVGIQGNTITKSFLEIYKVPKFVIGIILVFFVSIIVFGGLKRIAAISSKLVPFMSIMYIGIALFIGIKNINVISQIFKTIITSAFTLKSIYGGFLGSLIIGIQRGIFSNEAGLGTGSITSSTSSTDSPVSQGYIQMLGIYVTTLLICTATVIIVMTSNYSELVLNDVNGIEITQYAFKYHLGNFGNVLLFLSVLLFSFTTILTGYYDGESSLKYLFSNIKDKHLIILKVISLFVLFLGCIIPSETLWSFVDILMAGIAIINIYALFKLKGDVKHELRYYNLKKYDKINKR
ncbi:MAG: alanine:cation symporter family protein [Firmicutes bacterium]|nr:alanine:cation symporter family protein [Bacillota bacterium]